MPETKRPLKVFLCHASADKPKVRELYRYLRKRGIRPWFDEIDLVGGQDWQIEIPKALTSSDAIIICLSKHSVDKEGYIQKEIKFALDKALEMPEGRIFLIPVRFEECEVPFSLSRYQWVDLFDEAGYARMMRALKFRASQLQRADVEVPSQPPKPQQKDAEKVDKTTQERLERETADKARREEEERKAVEKARQEKARRDAAEEAKRKRAERRLAQIAALEESFSKSLNSLRSALPRAMPLLRVGGILGIVFALIWIGSSAIPQFLSPEFTATVNLTQPLVSTIAVTNSPLPVTKTVEPSATATQLITPSPTVLPTEIADAKGVQMVLVPAREFTMGSDNAAADERSAHSVSVDTFYMDRFEVTNQLYSACVSAGICQNPTHNYLQGPDLLIFIPQGGSTQGYEIDNYYSSTQYANFPVVFVSWSMAKTYCEWRDARLPTEAEWEKAARGTEGKIYPWGNDFDCHFGNSFDFTSNSPVRALYGPRCDKYIGTSPVGQFPGGVSSYGVYDLSGNVWEWVSSLYKPYPYKNSNAENSQEVGLRVFRGGSFLSSAVNSRSSKRQSASENYSATDLGFRCAKDATP